LLKFVKTDWFNALNIPFDLQNGLPVEYSKWSACPGGYNARDHSAFMGLLEKWYPVRFKNLPDDEKADLIQAWDAYARDGAVRDQVPHDGANR
jgi:hypothetical protein